MHRLIIYTLLILTQFLLSNCATMLLDEKIKNNEKCAERITLNNYPLGIYGEYVGKYKHNGITFHFYEFYSSYKDSCKNIFIITTTDQRALLISGDNFYKKESNHENLECIDSFGVDLSDLYKKIPNEIHKEASLFVTKKKNEKIDDKLFLHIESKKYDYPNVIFLQVNRKRNILEFKTATITTDDKKTKFNVSMSEQYSIFDCQSIILQTKKPVLNTIMSMFTITFDVITFPLYVWFL